jgi:hypothetical protein
MEQLVYSIAVRNGVVPSRSNATDLVRLLQSRLLSYQGLAESLVACRKVFINSDLDGIMQSIEVQSAHCAEIARADERIRVHTQTAAACGQGLLDQLAAPEAERVSDVLRRTAELRNAILELSRTHAGIIRKLAHNNAVLRNLYANALVYADPRLSQNGSCRSLEE